MLRKRRNRLLHKSMSITITFGVVVMLLLLSSCGGKQKAMGEAITERDSLPVMTTLGVTTLISDSGVTRYRVNTEEWMMYDRKKHFCFHRQSGRERMFLLQVRLSIMIILVTKEIS